jgi:hypothetical protein
MKPMARKKTGTIRIIKNHLTELVRGLNSFQRVLPDFLIIGAAKGGTTSLFNYLLEHPQMVAPLKKEVHYFDHHYGKGLKWYRMHFPTQKRMNEIQGSITGEASTYYLSHPLVPARVKELLPDVKLICMLRNPIDRALSNYNHMIRLGIETETFERAVELEEERTQGELEKLINNPSYYSFNHHHYSYLGRGIYYKELKRWMEKFPLNKILLLNSEEFYTDPKKAFATTTDYLKLNNWEPASFQKYNSGGEYETISPQLREKLNNFFRPHNEALFELTGKRFNWK